ncbi:MAG: hypothetical protein ACYTXA_29360 [Nostoc sp.]
MNRIKIADLVSTHSDNYLQNLSEEQEARVIGGLRSAGCMVGASSNEHYHEFMSLVQADPREKNAPGKYQHWTTVINGNEFLDIFPR